MLNYYLRTAAYIILLGIIYIILKTISVQRSKRNFFHTLPTLNNIYTSKCINFVIQPYYGLHENFIRCKRMIYQQ